MSDAFLFYVTTSWKDVLGHILPMTWTLTYGILLSVSLLTWCRDRVGAHKQTNKQTSKIVRLVTFSSYLILDCSSTITPVLGPGFCGEICYSRIKTLIYCLPWFAMLFSFLCLAPAITVIMNITQKQFSWIYPLLWFLPIRSLELKIKGAGGGGGLHQNSREIDFILQVSDRGEWYLSDAFSPMEKYCS